MAPIEIYTTRFCPYCNTAKALLKRKGAAFTEINLSQDFARRDEMIERANGRMTVPQKLHRRLTRRRLRRAARAGARRQA
jgi:glutaredoxin 3